MGRAPMSATARHVRARYLGRYGHSTDPYLYVLTRLPCYSTVQYSMLDEPICVGLQRRQLPSSVKSQAKSSDERLTG